LKTSAINIQRMTGANHMIGREGAPTAFALKTINVLTARIAKAIIAETVRNVFTVPKSFAFPLIVPEATPIPMEAKMASLRTVNP